MNWDNFDCNKDYRYTHPGEIPAFVPVHYIARVVGIYHNFLANAAAGTTDPSRELLQEYNVDLLVNLSAVAERAAAQRWSCAIDALNFGASREQVARALGMDLVEMVLGLQAWVDSQRADGEISDEELDDFECLFRPSGLPVRREHPGGAA